VTDAARDWIATKGYDVEYGARPLRRLIQNEIEDRLSDGILSGEFPIASVVQITAGEDGELLLRTAEQTEEEAHNEPSEAAAEGTPEA
jgi:ATP-dependent Clp protease ATP-binding subunit ClpC